jgi:hypothetical protein
MPAVDRLVADDRILADLTQEYRTLRVNGVRMDYKAWVKRKLAPVLADLDGACRENQAIAPTTQGVSPTCMLQRRHCDQTL